MKACVKEIIANRWLISALRVVLGGIFIAASVGKLQQPAEFTNTVLSYGILPNSLAQFYGFILPWVELFIGCALVLGIFSEFASALSIPLIISFVMASSYSLLRPVGGDCGCFGEVVTLSHPVALSLDVVMLAMALLLLFNEAREKFLSIGLLLSRHNPGSGRRVRFIFEKTSKLIIVVLAMVVVIPFIGGAQSLTNTEIDSALGEGKVAFLFFYRAGCPPCEAEKLIINELEQEYGDRVVFIRIDYAEAPQAVQEFDVKGAPAMLLVTGKNDEGEYIVYQRFEGRTDKKTLRDSLSDVLARGLP